MRVKASRAPKRFVEQKHPGMIDQRARQGNALRHAAGEMVRKGISKGFEPDQTHEFIDLGALFPQHAARDEAGFDVSSDGEPREKIGILKDEPAFRARLGNRLGTDGDLAGRGARETGNHSQQGRFSATARPDNRNQLPCRDGERYVVQGQRTGRHSTVERLEFLRDVPDSDRGCFVPAASSIITYHLITPFCQTRTRSRTLKSSVMMVEKKAAITTKAP